MEMETILAVIEIPQGSRNKYEYDPALGRFKLDQMLFSAVHYPHDYGFVLDTIAEDGDSLDAVVIVGEATFPGCVIEANPIALFKMWDEKGPDEKILCVPLHDPKWNWISHLSEVPKHLLREIEHFFAIYKELEEKKTGIEGWAEAEEAEKVIAEARKRYLRQKKG